MKTQLEKDLFYMSKAIELAKRAALIGEVPVGAVLVVNDKILARGWNLRESKQNPIMHAEIVAILKASKKLASWRIPSSTLYVTLEPCLMCAGAIYQARINRVVFGALDSKAGACGSLYSIHNDSRLNHRFEVLGKIMAHESTSLMKSFFKSRRSK
ncbi:MAG: tRNA adenosine(34) deaminase TadA [Proteobacteria bacterium]|nr:tRNA adenosine(34) deaminase TadA [Pseudomonadota bacterium]